MVSLADNLRFEKEGIIYVWERNVAHIDLVRVGGFNEYYQRELPQPILVWENNGLSATFYKNAITSFNPVNADGTVMTSDEANPTKDYNGHLCSIFIPERS